jgi:choline dehydrogenase-like flavoprotein
VRYRNWEGVEKTAESSVYVLAAHAIESAVLLQVSDTANSSGKVGRFLMDHPQGYGVGLSNEPLFPFRGPPTTSGIDVFRDGDFRKTRAAFRISIGNDGWGRWKGEDKLETILNDFTGGKSGGDCIFLIGEKLKSAVEDIGTRIFRFSYSTEMLPIESNRVTLDEIKRDALTGLPLPKIHFKIDDENNYNQQAFGYAGNVLKAMFRRIGVPDNEVQTISDIKDFSGAGHIMGTTKMGMNKSDSVVDKDCRTHDHANLFLVGAGVFPTGGTANPSLTVAALSLRLADYIKSRFDDGEFFVNE